MRCATTTTVTVSLPFDVQGGIKIKPLDMAVSVNGLHKRWATNESIKMKKIHQSAIEFG